MSTQTLPADACPSFIREESLPYGFCPGCGHIKIAGYIDGALRNLGLPPEKVVIVTDIGCIGMIDKHFNTNAFHGLHGRVITYASGIKLANPDLTVIAIMGDGGAGIGGAHLLSVARRNLGITLVVSNNFNYGMTGGQHSCTTPLGAVTPTTLKGNLEAPLDFLRTLLPSKPSFLARTSVFADDQVDLLTRAITSGGFALVDIWDFCIAYFGGKNPTNRTTIEKMMEDLEMPAGVLYEGTRPEYSRAWRELYSPPETHDDEGIRIERPAIKGQDLEKVAESSLDHRVGILVAGGAGQKIRSLATLVGAAGIMSGLFATQKDDYPITVRTGHSIAEIILAPEHIHYTGIDTPDIVLLLSVDGLNQIIRKVPDYPATTRIYAEESLVPLLKTQAQVISLPLKTAAKEVGKLAIGPVGFGAILAREKLYPPEAFEAAATLLQKAAVAQGNIAGLKAGMAL
jgi:2-oxoglutarate ferredoxin oxidoreductase subunit beta